MNLICKNCNKPFVYHRRKQHCSDECFSTWRRRPDVLDETKRRRSASNIIKYGVANAANSDEVKAKAKDTCIQKYGAISPTQNAEIWRKQRDTCMQRYGTENPLQNLELLARQQSTLYANYGVTVPTKSKVVMQKIKDTVLKRYGTDNPAKHTNVKSKMLETNLRKYGTNHAMQNPDVQTLARSGLSNFFYAQISEKLVSNHIIPAFTALEYTNQYDYREYQFACSICNSSFSDHLMNGHIPECPICKPKKPISIPEEELVEFLYSIDSTLGIDRHNRKLLSGLELDIYIPSKKLAIEFNGNYWHSEISGKKNKLYHVNKTENCEKLGIQLIHIFEDEWIYKTNIIKNKLRSLLEMNTSVSISKNKCEIREIDADIAINFLNAHHLRGADKSSIRLGAYAADILVAVMTFGAKRLPKDADSTVGVYEIYRYCSIDGGDELVSELVAYFIKTYSPTKITTYVDRRFSIRDRCGFSGCGFSFVANTSPTYWYIHPKNSLIREYRFKYRKSALESEVDVFDSEKTEWENMKVNGYDRVWDCGSLKYELIATSS